MALNINQLDPSFLALGSALNDSVPNPFFGQPVGFNVTSPTISRAQSLRPFPQYGNILMGGSTLGKNQYHAAIFKFEKRVTNGWGGRINYTYSRLEDNQFGETNFFSRNSGFIQNAYDLEAEYGVGLLDVPHKIVMSPIFELPFGQGKRWVQSGVGAAILGDWTVSSIISLESGFPTSVSSNSNGLSSGFFQVQRVNPGTADPGTDGSRDERIQDVWITSAGYSAPALFTLGTLPRTDPDNRTPHRNNWDFVAAKDLRFGSTVRAQIKLEVLNVTNTVKTRGPIEHAGQFDLRSDSRARRLHAPDAGDVPRDVLVTKAGYAETRNPRKHETRATGRPIRAARLFSVHSSNAVRAGLRPLAGHSQHPARFQPGASTDPATPGAPLGSITFPATGNPKAHEVFIRGVLWLHSFAYEEAIDAFRAAQAIDPQFVMAYWGEAMCFNQPLWFGEEPDKARAALAKLGASPSSRAAKAKTPREQLYLAAIEALFGSGAKPERDQAFAAAMATLAGKFPQDDEAQSFYALSLLATLPRGDQALPLRERAGAIAEGVFKRNPRHPGAPHYILHAYDHSQLAARALPAARAYAKIAPAASHALHMPAHAFVQLGHWDEAAATDEASWEASIAWAKRRGLSVAMRDFHSLSWLQYEWTQQGRFDKSVGALMQVMSRP